jgi:hypothetical protein
MLNNPINYPNSKRKVSMDQLVYINTLSEAIKEDYQNLLSDINALVYQVEVLLPIEHQDVDSPLSWLKDLKDKLEKKKKVLGSVKVSETEFDHVSLDKAIAATMQLVNDHVTVFSK